MTIHWKDLRCQSDQIYADWVRGLEKDSGRDLEYPAVWRSSCCHDRMGESMSLRVAVEDWRNLGE